MLLATESNFPFFPLLSIRDIPEFSASFRTPLGRYEQHMMTLSSDERVSSEPAKKLLVMTDRLIAANSGWTGVARRLNIAGAMNIVGAMRCFSRRYTWQFAAPSMPKVKD